MKEKLLKRFVRGISFDVNNIDYVEFKQISMLKFSQNRGNRVFFHENRGMIGESIIYNKINVVMIFLFSSRCLLHFQPNS